MSRRRQRQGRPPASLPSRAVVPDVAQQQPRKAGTMPLWMMLVALVPSNAIAFGVVWFVSRYLGWPPVVGFPIWTLVNVIVILITFQVVPRLLSRRG